MARRLPLSLLPQVVAAAAAVVAQVQVAAVVQVQVVVVATALGAVQVVEAAPRLLLRPVRGK
jgi:hypothetical protein